AIGDERQRHADDGNEAHHHRRIDEDVEEEVGGDAERQQSPELAAAAEGDGVAIDEDAGVEREQQQAAHEAPFLGQHGEDEVGVLLRQEGEMRLAPLHEALAENAARADGDLGLQAVIAGAERVVLGIDEIEDAVLLIVAPEAPAMTMANFHQRTPARKNMAPPASTSIIAVPRSGCFITSAAGTRMRPAGGISHSGLPISSGVIEWK